MVRVVEDDQLVRSGVGPGETQGKVVGLGAATDEEADVERFRKGRGELQHVLGEIVVKVAGVGVELGHLPLGRLHHSRVAMAHMADVVDQVEVAAPAVVVQVLAAAADDLDGL